MIQMLNMIPELILGQRLLDFWNRKEREKGQHSIAQIANFNGQLVITNCFYWTAENCQRKIKKLRIELRHTQHNTTQVT